MGELNFASEISDYITQAQGLEAIRQVLVEKILEVAKTKIIPELTPLLPPRYSIDPNSTDVQGVGGDPLPYSNIRNSTHGEVPIGFSVSLRLLYDGKPIDFHGEASDGIGQIQKDLMPKLEELAEKYRLDHIMPFGEPIHM